MVNTKKLTERQMTLVGKIIKHFKGRTMVTRAELRAAHTKISGKVSSPYFISKNTAAQVTPNPAKGIARGTYNLAVFKGGAERGDMSATKTITKRKAVKSNKRANVRKGAKSTRTVKATGAKAKVAA
jgi:hypothetical protein